MKKLSIVITLLSITFSAFSQNIVPNPNFALFDLCPDYLGQVDRCTGWRNATHSSPDYYNVCHDTLTGAGGMVGVPTNAGGTRYSQSNAYAGVYTFTESSVNYREYIMADIPALVPGALYRVLLQVSLTDNSKSATNAPGILFYKDFDIGVSLIHNIPRIPQFNFSAYGNITDQTDWVTVTDTFTADSAYQHIIIGNFEPDATTTTTTVAPSTTAHFSYYYIDSVSVEKLPPPTHILSPSEGMPTVKISPNPFHDNTVLYLDNVAGTNNKFLIMNIAGTVIREIGNIGSGHTPINCDGLAPGLYFYQVHTQDHLIHNGKLVIR